MNIPAYHAAYRDGNRCTNKFSSQSPAKYFNPALETPLIPSLRCRTSTALTRCGRCEMYRVAQ